MDIGGGIGKEGGKAKGMPGSCEGGAGGQAPVYWDGTPGYWGEAPGYWGGATGY